MMDPRSARLLIAAQEALYALDDVQTERAENARQFLRAALTEAQNDVEETTFDRPPDSEETAHEGSIIRTWRKGDIAIEVFFIPDGTTRFVMVDEHGRRTKIPATDMAPLQAWRWLEGKAP